jgi:hypothetical protein
LQEAFKDLDGGGFTRAIGAEQAEAFARCDGESQAANGFDFAIVGLAQITAFDGGRHPGILAQALVLESQRAGSNVK